MNPSVSRRNEPTSAAGAARKNRWDFLNNPSLVGLIITDMAGSIVFCTRNWKPDPRDVKAVVDAWRGGNSIAVTLHSVKFSVLQSIQNRFIGTNIRKVGHLVGVTTTSSQRLLAFFLLDDNIHDGYMNIARASRATGQVKPSGQVKRDDNPLENTIGDSVLAELNDITTNAAPDLNAYFAEAAATAARQQEASKRRIQFP